MKYDIFISYRRNSYDSANLIATRLRAAGYTVFFDLESMRSGKFNEQLYDVIDNCKDFLLVLPPDALNRCVNEDDWVRLEICRAMDKKKNIIPIMLNGFEWPSPMPKGLEELCHYQALTASQIEYFDMAMERLRTHYLVSKPHFPISKFIKYASIVITTLFVLALLVWGIFLMLSRDICQKCATVITKDACSMHILAEENEKLSKDWEQFNRELDRISDKDAIKQLKADMLERVALAEKAITAGWMSDSTEMDISAYQSFLLSLHGINAEEIKVSPVFATMFYKDYLNDLDIMRDVITGSTTYNRLLVSALLESIKSQKNAYYAAILDGLSDFPDNALAQFHQLQPQWIYFPSEYKQGENSSYYENIINSENKKAEKIMSRYSSQLEQEDGKLDDLIIATEELEEEINEGFKKIEENINNTNETIQNQETKARIDEINRQYIKTYSTLKKSCAFNDNDNLWAKWDKIIRLGSFLAMDVENRKELSSEGLELTNSINPEVIYSDMVSLLSAFKSSHPETIDWASSAQTFYHDISKGQREYAGVIILGFKDNAKHSVFKAGDIITKVGGKVVKNYTALKEAFKQNENAEVTFIRHESNKFTGNKCKMVNPEIIGFINLTD